MLDMVIDFSGLGSGIEKYSPSRGTFKATLKIQELVPVLKNTYHPAEPSRLRYQFSIFVFNYKYLI